MGRPCKTLPAVVIRERDDCEFSFLTPEIHQAKPI